MCKTQNIKQPHLVRAIFSRALSKIPGQYVAKNSDWFIALFAPVVIGQSNCIGIGFSIVI